MLALLAVYLLQQEKGISFSIECGLLFRYGFDWRLAMPL